MQNPEEQICPSCCESKVGLNSYFAQCRHKGYCLKCCSKNLEQTMKENKEPKCFECQAPMAEDDGIFQYFGERIKEKWKRYKRKRTNPPCTVPDCLGFLKSEKCLSCSQAYCQKCLQFEHIGKCKSQLNSSLPKQIKQCPNCHIKFKKEGGCLEMTCPLCSYKFCFICSKQWESGHYQEHEGGCIDALRGWLEQKFGCCFGLSDQSVKNTMRRSSS